LTTSQRRRQIAQSPKLKPKRLIYTRGIKMMRYQKENKLDRERLELDIKLYLSGGGKIDLRKPGESKPVDATNEWPAGFYNDDNLKFTKKVPRNV
jgi:inner membrane protein involved in colicin E2 resistance